MIALNRTSWMVSWSRLAAFGVLACVTSVSASRALPAKPIAAPTISRLTPHSIDAGSPAFTLTVSGSGFQTDSTVLWTVGSRTTTLSTAYVSTTELRATVPTGLVANPGRAAIRVHTPSAGTSADKLFTVLVTSLQWNVAMSYNSGGEYTALLHITNSGYRTAENLTITRSILGSAGTTSALPMALGNLAAGATLVTDLTYPASAGDAGDIVALTIAGYFTGDSIDLFERVTLP